MKTLARPLRFIGLIYVLLVFFRLVEYLVLRTDQSIFGEAFVHKVAGIIVLIIALKYLHSSWSDIGFIPSHFVRGSLIGLALGAGPYIIAYATDFFMATSATGHASLQFYVSSYSPLGNTVLESSALLLLFCIVGNIINVIMEAGFFRGFSMKVLEQGFSFTKACAISSILFGLWHLVSPFRNIVDGQQSIGEATVTGLVWVIISTLLGVMWVLLYKITGSLWAGTVAHFINNTTINLLHVVTPTGADENQTLRIILAQSLTFFITMVGFIWWQKRHSINEAGA